MMGKLGWHIQHVDVYGSHQGVALPSCSPSVVPPDSCVPKYPVPVPIENYAHVLVKDIVQSKLSCKT